MAMNAARPAARTPLAIRKILNSTIDTFYSGLFLLRIFYPANKLIARDRRQAFPEVNRFH